MNVGLILANALLDIAAASSGTPGRTGDTGTPGAPGAYGMLLF